MNQQSMDNDLNNVIINAVNARVEAAVTAALAGDEVVGRLVTAALQRPVEVPSASGYGKDRKPFMSHIIETAVRDLAKTTLQRLLVEQQEMFEEEIRRALQEQAPAFARTMIGQLVDTASRGYGIQVSLRTGD